jgi:hypothetical protein
MMISTTSIVPRAPLGKFQHSQKLSVFFEQLAGEAMEPVTQPEYELCFG